MSRNVLSITEIIESKLNKERELEYYQEQLLEIQRKIGMLETDLKLTKTIIAMIENEKLTVIDNAIPLIATED